MIAQVQPQVPAEFTTATVVYPCKGSRPSKFNPNEQVTDIVVSLADGSEQKIWGEPALLRQCHRDCAVVLRRGPRAKNWKVASDRQGNVIREIANANALEVVRGANRRMRAAGLPPAPAPQPKPVNTHAIAAEISGLAGLYAECYNATRKALAGTGAPQETVQGAASSLFIQLNKSHSMDELMQYQGDRAKADMGF